MKILIITSLLLLFTFLVVGSETYKSDVLNNSVQENYSINLTWTEFECNNTSTISNFVCKAVNFGGWSVMEFAKYFVEFGYNNPEYDFNYGHGLIIFCMWVVIISSAFFPICIIVFYFYSLFNHYKNRGASK